MAKITTITNPLTGQPAQVDQLDHTAQQIDDAISRALPGGAIDTLLQNKAPSFPYYSAHSNLEIDAALNDLINKSFYNTIFSAINVRDVGLDLDGGLWGIELVNADGLGYAIATSYYYPNGVVRKMRMFVGDTWKPWEWVNPPMKLGKEYRTTERYLGKPVYVEAVDFGALPNSTIKIVTFGDSTTRVISAHGIMNGGYVIPGCTGASDYPSQEMQIFTEDGGKVGIVTHTDRTGYTAVVIVKYWKTTD